MSIVNEYFATTGIVVYYLMFTLSTVVRIGLRVEKSCLVDL